MFVDVEDSRPIPIEFVTLEDGSEGLIIRYYFENLYKFLYPFLPSDDTIDVTGIIDNHNKIIITKSNRKLSIIENKLHVTDGLNDNTFQQMLNKTYHDNIYTLSIFKTIQNMFIDVINKVYYNFPEDCKIELTDGTFFHFSLEIAPNLIQFHLNMVESQIKFFL